MLLIVCVECDRKNKSDDIYVMATIRHFYNDFAESNKITPIYLGGKFNYNNKRVENEIKREIKLYQQANPKGQYEVIYFLDTDEFIKDSTDSKFVMDVENYCRLNNYHVVWFVHKIEHVYLGRKSNSKTNDAVNFLKKKMIENMDIKKISNPNPRNKSTSNILCVLESVINDKNHK